MGPRARRARREARRRLDPRHQQRRRTRAAHRRHAGGVARGGQGRGRALRRPARSPGCVLRRRRGRGQPARQGPRRAHRHRRAAQPGRARRVRRPRPPASRRSSRRCSSATAQIYQAYEPKDARYLSNHRGHLMFLRPEEHEVCTAELIRATTFTGTRAQSREQLRELARAGFAHVGITDPPRPPRDAGGVGGRLRGRVTIRPAHGRADPAQARRREPGRRRDRALIAAWSTARSAKGQIAAFAMAVFFRGMTHAECAWLTRAMARSGAVSTGPAPALAARSSTSTPPAASATR